MQNIIDGLDSVVIDTSAIMHTDELIKNLINFYNINIHICVVEELDNLKNNVNLETAFKARKAIKQIEKFKSYVGFILDRHIDKTFLQGNIANNYNHNDDIIVSSCIEIKAKLITKDLNLKVKAEALNIECIDLIYNQIEYNGYKEVLLKDEELAYLYENININTHDCLINEYLVIKNTDGNIVDNLKWNGEKYINLKYKQVKNDFLPNIKPKNLQQELAFDMLQDTNTTIKVLTGRFGSGKSFLMVANAINLIKNNKYDKLMYIRNNIEVKNSKPIGFLPNGKEEKLMPFAMILADHLGGKDGLEMFINQGKIEIEHLGFIRGRDIKNTIVMVSEAENMTKEHMQLLISRIGENSCLWLDGDFKQVDDIIFERNSGLLSVINKLKGNSKFGYVKLLKTERGETADMADLLD